MIEVSFSLPGCLRIRNFITPFVIFPPLLLPKVLPWPCLEGPTIPYSLFFCTKFSFYRTPLNAPHFFPGCLPHTSQGYFLGGVWFGNPNAIKHPYIIIILLVAVAVPLVHVLAVILIILLVIIAPTPVLFCLWW